MVAPTEPIDGAENNCALCTVHYTLKRRIATYIRLFLTAFGERQEHTSFALILGKAFLSRLTLVCHGNRYEEEEQRVERCADEQVPRRRHQHYGVASDTPPHHYLA